MAVPGGRTRTAPGGVQSMNMKKGAVTSGLVGRGDTRNTEGLPTPSMQFRRRAWLIFQRALDPLAAPKQLPTRRN
jgi:hypothetical protein